MVATRIRKNQVLPNTLSSGEVDSSVIVAAGSNAFTGDQSMGGFKLISVADPVNPQDVLNLRYAQSLIQGLAPKGTATYATAAALPSNTYNNGASGVGATLTATGNGALSVDGNAVVIGDLILVKNEATTANNGLYTVTAAGSGAATYVLTRATNMDAPAEIAGAQVFVRLGTANANTSWMIDSSGPYTVGTTAITWTQLFGASSYTGSSSIQISANSISAIFGTLSGTICEGNDARLSNARTPVSTTLNSTQIFVGSSGNLAAAVTMTGDVTISNTGVTTVNNTSGSGFTKYGNFVIRETPSGTINGVNVTFTLANTPVAGTEQVYWNGLLLEPGAGNDYTISGVTISMLSAPATGDRLKVSYLK